MKRLVFAAFGILLVGPLTPIAAEEISPERGEKIEKLYRRAGDLYQKKDHRGAAEAWEELLYLLPGGGDESEMRLRVHYMAALNYALLRKEKEAVAHLEKAIEHGLREPSSLERQSDFDAIRRSAGFAALPEIVAGREYPHPAEPIGAHPLEVLVQTRSERKVRDVAAD